MKTEEELIWEAYKPKLVRESSDVEDILYYYNDGATPEEIAEEYAIDIKDVLNIIKNEKSSSEFIDDSDIIDDFKLNPKKHREGDISIKSDRTDITDRNESGHDWEGTSHGFVNDVKPTKSRRETLDKIGKKYNKVKS
jgi:hypothetical protein